jgi:hypothetical protein
MKKSPSFGQQEKSQRDRFIETARAIGVDEDEAAFKAKLAVIARQKPKASSSLLKPAEDEVED